MAIITEARIRDSLVRRGVCDAEAASDIASAIVAEINGAVEDVATEDKIEAAIARLEATIERMFREFTEKDAERERQRDERERQRDERERQRIRDQEARDRRLYAVLGLGFAAMSVLVAVFGALG